MEVERSPRTPAAVLLMHFAGKPAPTEPLALLLETQEAAQLSEYVRAHSRQTQHRGRGFRHLLGNLFGHAKPHQQDVVAHLVQAQLDTFEMRVCGQQQVLDDAEQQLQELTEREGRLKAQLQEARDAWAKVRCSWSPLKTTITIMFIWLPLQCTVVRLHHHWRPPPYHQRIHAKKGQLTVADTLNSAHLHSKRAA